MRSDSICDVTGGSLERDQMYKCGDYYKGKMGEESGKEKRE